MQIVCLLPLLKSKLNCESGVYTKFKLLTSVILVLIILQNAQEKKNIYLIYG